MVKHLIVSGCSFTSDGIGGVPLQGCSYYDNPGYPASVPGSWVGYLAQKLQLDSLVNLAGASHGNGYIANSLLEVLERFNYPQDTLVLFNVSEFERLDIPCAFDHPDVSNRVPWDSNIIPYSYIDKNSSIQKQFVKHTGFEQIEQTSLNSLKFLFSYLKQRNINFYFLLMENYTTRPAFANLVQLYTNNMIAIDNEIGMREYCATHGYNTIDGVHPDVNGHQVIADIVYKTIAG